MRILVVTSEAPPIVSGISRCVGHLVDGLRERGHEVDVISSVTMKRFVVGEFRISSFVLHWPRIARQLSSYDVINLHGPVPTLSDAFLFFVGLRRKAKRRPIVYTHHSAIEITGWEAASDLYNVVHKWLAKNADVTLTTSQYYRDSLFSPTHKLARVVPWGVEHFDTTAHLSRPASPLKVLFVGQMRPYKGVGVLLDAANGSTDLQLTLIGSGPDLQHHRQTVSERGQEHVVFAGRVSDEDLDAAYHEADVVVLPSLTRAEAFGLVVLEGMASGAVPVVSDLPGVRDLAEGPGIVVTPGDVDELREALVSLATDRVDLLRRHRAALAKAQALSWDNCVASYEAVMQELVGEPPVVAVVAPINLVDVNHQVPALLPVPVVPSKRRVSAFSGAARRWIALVATIPLLLLAGCQTTSPGMASTPPPELGDALSVGTLLSTARANAAEVQGGVTAAMVEVEWHRAEPARGEFDLRYLESVRQSIETFQASGRTVALGLGVHYTPDWVFSLPNSRYVNQYGESSDQLNMVFNADVRSTALDYFTELDRRLGLENLDAIRFTSGGSGEVLYPGTGAYWAFDANAQGGHALPATMSSNPAPGWRPGEPVQYRGMAAEWASWYVGALADVVDWQRTAVRSLGFTGYEQILTPGLGVRPHQFSDAVANELPDGLLGVGAAWDRIYASLESSQKLVAHSTSVADRSGGDSGCQASDRTLPLAEAGEQDWSAVRWLRRVADENSLPLTGENPGFGLPSELSESYVDPSPAGMMQSAFRLAQQCDLAVFYWAHDRELWNGTVSAELFFALTGSIEGDDRA